MISPRAQVRYIVLFSGSERVVEPNEGGVSSGVQVLDDFIQENFSVVRQFGNYSILRRTEG